MVKLEWPPGMSSMSTTSHFPVTPRNHPISVGTRLLAMDLILRQQYESHPAMTCMVADMNTGMLDAVADTWC